MFLAFLLLPVLYLYEYMITEDHYTACPCILQLFGCMQRLIKGSNFSLCFPHQFDISWISGGCDSSKKKTQEDVSSGFSLNLNLLVISCVWCHVCTCILFPISCWHHVFFQFLVSGLVLSDLSYLTARCGCLFVHSQFFCQLMKFLIYCWYQTISFMANMV